MPKCKPFYSGANLKKPGPVKNDFSLVVENAFDFFKKSLEEFDKEPKYSVIHFHAAVELIMKARLLWEHWTLIITRPETANLKSFRSGDFQSVRRNRGSGLFCWHLHVCQDH